MLRPRTFYRTAVFAAMIAGCAGSTAPTHQIVFLLDGTPGASIEGEAVQTLRRGSTSQQVTAVPPVSHDFARWTYDEPGGVEHSTANPLAMANVSSDMTLVANFAVRVYDVKFLTDGTDGASIEGVAEQSVEHGFDAQQVTAVPPAGYDFVNWTFEAADGAEHSTENPLALTNVTADTTLVANFAIRTYTVSFLLDDTEGASIEGDAEQFVPHGSAALPVTAVPSFDHDFTRWTYDEPGGVEHSTANPLTLTNVTADITLVANFAIRTYTVSFLVDETEGAAIEGETPQLVTHGSNAQVVTAVPPSGYAFVRWTYDEAGGVEHSKSNPLEVTDVAGSVTLVANFARIFTVEFVTDSTAGASIEGETPQEVVDGGSTSGVEAVMPVSHRFVNWTLGSPDGAVYSTDNPLVATGVTSGMTLVANFAIRTYSVTFDTDGTSGASVEGEMTQTVEHGASASAVEAIPPLGDSHYFAGWTLGEPGGQFYSDANPLTAAGVTSDLALFANFAPVSFTITFRATSGGYLVVGGVPQGEEYVEAVVSGGSTSSVGAINHPSYLFEIWQRDGETYTNTNPLTIHNVTDDITVTAVFMFWP